MVSNDLEGQNGMGGRREVQEGGNICVPGPDAC